MALDTPLFRDGGQTTAAANYYNPSSALAGPGGSGQFLGVVLSASRVLSVQTTLGGQIYGVLQNTPPAASEACDVGLFGITKAVAGASITYGTELMVDASGRMITWTSGSGYYKVGLSVETAAAANTVFSMLLYNPNITGHNLT